MDSIMTNQQTKSIDLPLELKRRGVFVVGSGIYVRCVECGSIVKLNKLFVGSLHFCASSKQL
jgi:hypothetical protein